MLRTSLMLLLFTAVEICAAQNSPTEPAATLAAEPITVANAPAKITSLIKIDNKIGTGAEASPGLYLDVNYTGWLYDPKKPDKRGNKFDRCNWPRGEALGGSFSLDYMIYIRGKQRGYDKWSSLAVFFPLIFENSQI